MTSTIKAFIDAISSPVTIFIGSMSFFALMMGFPKFFFSNIMGILYLAATTGFFALGYTDHHFREIMCAPDNVPIVGMIFIFGYFTWYAMHKAVINDCHIKKGEPTIEQNETNDKVLVFPYLIYIEFVMALAYSILLVVWSILLKAPLEEPANPTFSPNPSKAPWYFLGLQEMLVYFDPWIAGVLLPTFIIIGLCAIPYLDRNTSTSGFFSYKKRRTAIVPFMFGFWILWILLILFGTFLRGPNWNFFGPFEEWTVHKVVPLLNVNLSEFIFIKWMNRALPNFWIIREAPGILLVGLYFAIPPMILAKTYCKGIYERLQPVRYHILMFTGLMMLSLPLKMFLRWAFNLKYIVAIPEFFFNI